MSIPHAPSLPLPAARRRGMGDRWYGCGPLGSIRHGRRIRPASPARPLRGLDTRPVNLDGFAQRDDEAGLVAFASANDPEPSVALDADGRVTELDGTAAPDFDLIDAFIAARGLDAAVAEEANALDDVAFARLIVDPGTPRAEVVRLAAGATPEKLARVVALLRPVELQMASASCACAARPATRRTSPTGSTTRCCSPPTRPPRSPTASARSRPPCPSTPTRRPTPSPCSSARRSAPPARSRSARSRRPSSSTSASGASPPTPRPSASTAPRRSSSTATTRPGPRRSSARPTPRAGSRCG